MFLCPYVEIKTNSIQSKQRQCECFTFLIYGSFIIKRRERLATLSHHLTGPKHLTEKLSLIHSEIGIDILVTKKIYILFSPR